MRTNNFKIKNNNIGKSLIISTLLIGATLIIGINPVFAQTTPNTVVSKADLKKGEALFSNNCSMCHGMDGAGQPGMFPPLKDSSALKENKDIAIHFVLHGHSGTLKVNGVTYDGTMPPVGASLTDSQVMLTINYVLNSFGNNFGTINEKDIDKVKSKSN